MPIVLSVNRNIHGDKVQAQAPAKIEDAVFDLGTHIFDALAADGVAGIDLEERVKALMDSVRDLVVGANDRIVMEFDERVEQQARTATALRAISSRRGDR